MDVVQQPVRAVQAVLIPDPLKVFHKDRLRVLLIGLDYDYDRLDQETSKSSRSDIIMALSLDFKNHRISELSVPRDMVATLPNGQQAKINQAQSEGGIAESKSVIASWLGVPSFDRYIVMRIDTTKDLIDAIGLSGAFSFKYSPRPGTPGAEMDDQVAEDVKSQRLQRLQETIDRNQAAFNRRCLHRTFDVLFERPGRHGGQLVGRSPYLQPVQVDAPVSLIGEIAAVTVTEIASNSLFGALAQTQQPPASASLSAGA